MLNRDHAIELLEQVKRSRKLTMFEEMFVKNIQRLRPLRALSNSQEAILKRITNKGE